MVRKLRIAFSAVCAIVCLLIFALWVRSNWWADGAVWQFTKARNISWVSHTGRIGVVIQSDAGSVGFMLGSVSASADPGFLGPDSWFYNSDHVDQFGHVVFPHWFPIVLLAAFAVLPWIHWRFSLRTLLVVMTLAAVGLGAIVWAVR